MDVSHPRAPSDSRLAGFRVYGQMKTRDALKKYIEYAPASYGHCIKLFLKFAPEDLSKIKVEHWERFALFLSARYKTYTIKDYLTKTKCFINYYRREGELKINPRRLKVPKPISTRVVATHQEYKKLCCIFNEWEFFQLKRLLAIKFMALGLRIGEVRALNISQVTDAKKWRSEKGDVFYFIKIVGEKGLKERHVVWPRRMQDQLIRYIGPLIAMSSNDALFVNRDGKRITNRGLERWFNEAKFVANISSGITCHSLRHMRAHLAKDKDGKFDLKAVQLILGHSSLRSTENYTVLTGEETVHTLQKYLQI